MSLRHTTRELTILDHLQCNLEHLAVDNMLKQTSRAAYHTFMVQAWAHSYQQERINQFINSRPIRRLINYIKTGR